MNEHVLYYDAIKLLLGAVVIISANIYKIDRWLRILIVILGGIIVYNTIAPWVAFIYWDQIGNMWVDVLTELIPGVLNGAGAIIGIIGAIKFKVDGNR